LSNQISKGDFIEHAKAYKKAYCVLDKLKVDYFRKRKLLDIIGCYKITEQLAPDVRELANKTEEDLDKIYQECFKRAEKKIRIPRF